MQTFQFTHISLLRQLNCPLRKPVAQHQRRIHAAHPHLPLLIVNQFIAQARAIIGKPAIEGLAVDKFVA